MILTLLDDQELLIRNAISLQLDSLEDLADDDITLICIQEEIENREAFVELMGEKKKRFSRAMDNPHRLFVELTEEDLSIFRHILYTYFEDDATVPSITRKLNTFESFNELIHLN